jgi:hypothetical protein
MSSEIFIPEKAPSMMSTRARRSNKARLRKTAKRKRYYAGGRPRKIDDYVVHRIAELIQMADGIHENKEVRKAMARGGITFHMADGSRTNIDTVDEIAVWVGRIICGDVGGSHLKPEYRPQILRQLADALERKSARKRKSGKADDVAKIRTAWLKAKAKQKGLYRGEDPTFREVAEEYLRLTGYNLDRRALKNAGRSVRVEAKSKKLSPRTK